MTRDLFLFLAGGVAGALLLGWAMVAANVVGDRWRRRGHLFLAGLEAGRPGGVR